MKKLKIALLIVLLISMVTCMFACNDTPVTPPQPEPIIPVPPADDNPIEDDTQGPTVSTVDAWNAFKNAALAVHPGSDIVNFDVDLDFDYSKDKTGNNFAIKLAGAIDTDFSDGSDDSELLFELLKRPLGIEQQTLLMGLYYTSETVVMDVTGLKGKNGAGLGRYVVRTQDINVTALLNGLAEIYQGVSGGQSIADIIFDTILAIDAGEMIPEGLLPIKLNGLTLEWLLVESGFVMATEGAQIVPLVDGGQRIVLPFDLSLIMSLVPSLVGMLPDLIGEAIDIEQIYSLVFDLTGMDLNKLEHLKGMTLDFVADINKEGKLSGMNLGVGVDFESEQNGRPDPDYGKYFADVDLVLNVNKLALNEDIDIDVEQAMLDRGIDISDAMEYSLLTFNLSMGLNINTHSKELTLEGVSPAFGTLLTGLLSSFLPEDSPLWTMPIGLGDITYGLKVNLQAQINTKDNSKTNILIELLDNNGGNRGTIVYSGQQEALFIDLTGLMGTGSFVISDINLNKVIADLFDMLVAEIEKALAENPDNPEAQAMADEISDKLGNGEILHTLSAAASDDDEPITDIISLVSEIVSSCTLVKDGNIFNIQSLNMTLTEKVFDYLWTMIFKDENGGYTGEKIPVKVVDVEFVDIGFAEEKKISINASIGADEEIVGLGIDATMQFGWINNEEEFVEKVTISDEERALYTELDLSGGLNLDTILGALNNVYVGMSVDVDLVVIQEELTKIDLASSRAIFLQAIVDFVEQIETGAVLSLEANIDLTKLLKDGQFDIAGLLEASVHMSLAEKGSDEKSIEIWLNDGMLYLHTADSIIDGIDISIPAKELLAHFGVIGGDSEAMSADGEGEEGEVSNDSMNQIIALVAGLIGGVDVSGASINVYLASGLIQTLIDLIGFEAKEDGYVALSAEELASYEAGTFTENVFVKDENGVLKQATGAFDASETYYKLAGTRLDIGLLDSAVDGGIRITFADGIDLTELGVEVYLNFDDKLDLDVNMGNLKLGINSVPEDVNLDVPTDIDFVNIFETPNIFLGLEMALDAQLNQGNTPMGNGGAVIFEEEINLGYDLRVQASLDLAPVLDWLLGAEEIYTNGNETQILIEAIENKNSVEKFILGLYYIDGKLYVDASQLGVEKIAVEIDLYAIILDLILGEDSNVKINPDNAEAMSAGDDYTIDTPYDVSKFDYALGLAMMIGNESIRLEIFQGIVEALWDVAGINIAIIEAALEISWAEQVEGMDEQPLVTTKIVGMDQNKQPTGSATLDIYRPELQITHEIIDVIPYNKTADNAHEDFVFDGREDSYALISLLDIDEEGKLAIALEQVYVQLTLKQPTMLIHGLLDNGYHSFLAQAMKV